MIINRILLTKISVICFCALNKKNPLFKEPYNIFSILISAKLSSSFPHTCELMSLNINILIILLTFFAYVKEHFIITMCIFIHTLIPTLFYIRTILLPLENTNF